MTIRFSCECGQSLSARDEYAGKRVRCNACNATQTVPAAGVPAGGDEPAQQPAVIRFACEDCGKSVQAKPEHAGKKTKCPGCGTILTIPAAAAGKNPAVATSKPKPPPVRADEEDEEEDRPDDAEDQDERARGGKKKRAGSKKGLWIGVAVVLLLAGAGFGAWMLFFRGGSASAEFDLVPRDAMAFATIRVQDALSSDLGKKAMSMAREQIGENLKEAEAKIGLSIEDIERATYVFFDPKTYWMIVRTSKPYDREKILSALKEAHLTEKEYKGKKYHASEGPSFWFLDDKNVVVSANSQGMERVIDLPSSPKKGPLNDLIVEASKSKAHMFVGGNVAEAKIKMGGLMGGGMPLGGGNPTQKGPGVGGPGGGQGGGIAGGPAANLLEAQTAHFTCNFGDKIDLSLALDFASADKASSAEKELNDLVNLGKLMLLGGGVAALGKDFPGDAVQAMNIANKVLEQIKPKQDGKRLSVSVSIDKADIEKVIPGPQKVGGGGGGVGGVREAALVATAQKNFRQIGVAFHNYASDHNSKLPAAAIYDEMSKPLLSWRVALLPYVGENKLYKQIHLNEPWNSLHNKQFWNQMPKVYQLPGHDAPLGETFVQAFTGPKTLFNGSTAMNIGALPDGTSNTILTVEAKTGVNWMAPLATLTPRNPRAGMGVHYRRGTLVGMADSTVRFVSPKVSDETLKNAIDPSDGNPLGADWGN